MLILQDDAVPCSHFAEAAHAALAARPADPVCFFLAAAPHRSARALEQAAWRCEHWSEIDQADWLPAVAIAFPAEAARDLREWVDARTIPPHRTSDDAILGEWMRAHHRRILATVPSLVQHDDAVRSIMGNAHTAGRSPARVAHCFVGDYDARKIAW